MPDLDGARVLVTRPAHQAAKLCALIRDAGGEPIALPTLEIADPSDIAARDAALRKVSQAAWAIFVSPNAVRRGLPLLAQHNPLATLRFAAVGAGTTLALRNAGIAEVLTPHDQFDSEALLDILPTSDLRDHVVLLFRGEGGRELLGKALAAHGAQVVHVVCYRRARPANPDPATLARLAHGQIDVITATSREGIENLVAMAGDAARTALLATPLIITSSRQAEAAHALGFHGDIRIADKTDDAAIVAAVGAWRAARNSL